MQLPMPLRAALGLAAEVVDTARHLPDRAIELPMLAVSTALQMSVRAQQRYAMLAARGDELLHHAELGDDPPPWATFDEEQGGAVSGATGPGSDSAVDGGAESNAVSAEAGPVVGPAPGKRIRAPRKGAPSRFDAVGEE